MVKKIPLISCTESPSDEDTWTKTADVTIGCLYLACFAFGVPNNLASLCFFARRCCNSRPNITTYLYCLASLQDTLISVLALYCGLVLLRDRDVWDSGVCTVHLILFLIAERMSVFLVAVLSVSRTYTLAYPMRKINVKSILTGLVVIWVLVATATSLLALPGPFNIEFNPHDASCRLEIEGQTLRAATISLNMLGIATPAIPTLVSCVFSIRYLKRSRKTKFGSIKMTKQGRKRMRKTNNQMTHTIILVTFLYILLKIPLCASYLTYWISVLLDKCLSHSSPFLLLYSWNISFMLCTALLSCANPVVYIARFKRYRRWLRECCRRQPGVESSVTARVTYNSCRLLEVEQLTEYHDRPRTSLFSILEDTAQ